MQIFKDHIRSIEVVETKPSNEYKLIAVTIKTILFFWEKIIPEHYELHGKWILKSKIEDNEHLIIIENEVYRKPYIHVNIAGVFNSYIENFNTEAEAHEKLKNVQEKYKKENYLIF